MSESEPWVLVAADVDLSSSVDRALREDFHVRVVADRALDEPYDMLRRGASVLVAPRSHWTVRPSFEPISAKVK